MIIGISIFIGIMILILIGYNVLVKRRQRVMQAKSTIDIYLTQRFELIPNLTQCVKSYQNYEADTITKITNIRMEYEKERQIQNGILLNNQLNNFLVVLENNPELKANQQFLNLQKSLIKLENQLQAARRLYNTTVLAYNKLIVCFQMSLLAKLCKMKKEEFFQAETDASASIVIKEELS